MNCQAFLIPACAGHQEIVELLLKRHANPAATNKKHEGALKLAKTDAIKTLVQVRLCC